MYFSDDGPNSADFNDRGISGYSTLQVAESLDKQVRPVGFSGSIYF